MIRFTNARRFLVTSNSLPAFGKVSGKIRIKTTALAFAGLMIFSLVLAACGGGGQSTTSTTKHILKIGASVGGNYTEYLSPYNPVGANPGILGMVYETLYFINISNNQQTPMLATSYAYNSDDTQLTFTTRTGVKWSDGQPFSASDVAFTFNMLHQYPAADANGLWTYLSSVTATNSNTVVMTFKKAYPPLFWYIAGKTFIVPQHTFANQDPTKFANNPPIGTGPFTLTRFSPTLLVYDKNARYWQANNVHVDELQYPTVKDNQTLQLDLMSGQIDWGGFFAPDLQQTFVAKDPAHNHYWMAPDNMFALYVNLSKYPLNQVAVRQAISLAIDRTQLSKNAESGYVQPASTTGLVLPNEQSYLLPQYASSPTTANAAQAIQTLKNAGFKQDSSGIFVDKNGKEFSFNLDTVTGYTDWDTMSQIIAQDLKNVGIKINVQQKAFASYANDRSSLGFDLLIGGMFDGPTPFYLYNTHLNSANLSPNGWDWEHWNNTQTDQLLNQYATTTNPSVQMQAIQSLETIFAQNLPTIPLVNAADWYEYSTKNFTGFPDQSNPYAIGATYAAPDNEMVVLHLTPAS